MATTTIDRSAIGTNDSGAGLDGTVVNTGYVGSAIYDKVDALLAGAMTWGGVHTNPVQPRARAYNSAVQSIANVTVVALTFDTEDFNVGALHSVSVNTSRMTIPAGGAGLYLVIGKAEFAVNATGQRIARIYKNGVNVGTQMIISGSASIAGTLLVTVLDAAVAADYYELQVYQDSGGALNVGSAARQDAAELSIVKLW